MVETDTNHESFKFSLYIPNHLVNASIRLAELCAEIDGSEIKISLAEENSNHRPYRDLSLINFQTSIPRDDLEPEIRKIEKSSTDYLRKNRKRLKKLPPNWALDWPIKVYERRNQQHYLEDKVLIPIPPKF